MDIKGQDHSLTLVQGHSDATFSNLFSLETARLIEAKFHVNLPWNGGTKVCSNCPGYMTKMAAMPIYGKSIKNLLLWNQNADDLETWYAVLGTRVLPNLFKWWPWVDLDVFYLETWYAALITQVLSKLSKWWLWVDLDLFHSKVKFGPFCFCMGKCFSCRRNYWSLWGEGWNIVK